MTAGRRTRITVVMPVHNASAYLAETLDSLLRQTLAEFDILAIDDGSTDDSARILRSCRDSRLRVVTRAARGVAATRNEGIALCDAPLVAVMDADDRCHPERLERQLRAFEADPQLVMLGSRAAIIDSAGVRMAEPAVLLGDAAIRRTLAVANCFVHGSVAYRTEAAHRAGGYRDAARPAADYDFLANLSTLGRVANLPETLYEWRSHSAGVSRSQRAAQRIAADRVADKVWSQHFDESGPAPREAWPEVWTEDLDRRLGANLHLEFARGYLRHGTRGLALRHVQAALALRPGAVAAWGYLPSALLPAPWFVALDARARHLMEQVRGW